jgi:hypothetical protein
LGANNGAEDLEENAAGAAAGAADDLDEPAKGRQWRGAQAKNVA